METILSNEGPIFQNQGIFPALYLSWNEVGDPQFYLYFRDITNLLDT